MAAAAMTSPLAPYLTAAWSREPKPPKSPNDRPRIAVIGMRYQGAVIAEKAKAHGDLVAFCDVDRHVREMARACFGSTQKIYEDYSALLDDQTIDIVLIGARYHWHARMAIDAMQAGKDVYVEKPLTLTVDEGKAIRKVAEETRCVVQVGTWQRSDIRFRLAAELVRRSARHDPEGGRRRRRESDRRPLRFGPGALPSELGLMARAGREVGLRARAVPLYVPLVVGLRRREDDRLGRPPLGYHPVGARRAAFRPGSRRRDRHVLRHQGWLRGADEIHGQVYLCQRRRSRGSGRRRERHPLPGRQRVAVRRAGEIRGSVIDGLKDNPLPREKFTLYGHDPQDAVDRTDKLGSLVSHMENFFACVQSRNRATLSDIESQHRSATVCHLGNIAVRLGRKLRWDPTAERFVGDSEADGMLSRVQRKGFEVRV